MPILGRTSGECFRAFAEHMRAVVGKILGAPVAAALGELGTGERRQLTFREGKKAMPVALSTAAHGDIYLHLAQLLETVDTKDKQKRLRTLQYWYRLQDRAGLDAPAIIRWEYKRDEPKHCRHHVQTNAAIRTGKAEMDLNKLHVPSGWVTFEEVLRFVVHDLGVSPVCGDDWPEVLRTSERRFFEEFTEKRWEK